MTFHSEMLAALPFDPTPDQEGAIQSLYSFFEGDASICILRGFAGTGKRSLVSALVHALDKAGVTYSLLSPTNQSARRLEKACQQPVTPLRDQLYALTPGQASELFTQMNAQHPEPDSVLIVDQAGMLSTNPSETDSEVIHPRGMLTDLLTYIQREPTVRLVLVVDPTDYPYLEGQRSSPLSALSFSHVYKGAIEEIDLTQIPSDVLSSSAILNTTMLHAAVRRDRFVDQRTIIDLGEADLQRIRAKDLPAAYEKTLQRIGTNAVQVLCRTHAKAHEYNQLIHRRMHGPDEPLAVGDRVVVTKPYTDTALLKEKITYLSDGEIAVVHAVGPQERIGDFAFQHVVISVEVAGGRLASVPAMVKLNTLFSERPRFTFQERAELIDLRKQDYQKIDRKVLYDTLLTDPYINALEIEYAYALTVQRARGSAWEHVIIDSEDILEKAPPEQAYRWLYTALKCSENEVTFVDLPDSRVYDDLPETLAEVVYLPQDGSAPSPAGPAATPKARVEEELPDWVASYQSEPKLESAAVAQAQEPGEEVLPDWLTNPGGDVLEEEQEAIAAEEPQEEPAAEPQAADPIESLRAQLIAEETQPDLELTIEEQPEEVVGSPKKAQEPFHIPLLDKLRKPAPEPQGEEPLAPDPQENNESVEQPYFDWPAPSGQEPAVPAWERGAPQLAPWEYAPEKRAAPQSAPWEFTPEKQAATKEPADWEILPGTKPNGNQEKKNTSSRWIRWLLVILLVFLTVSVVVFTGGQPLSLAAIADATETPTAIPASPSPTEILEEEIPTPPSVSLVTGCAKIGGLRIRQAPTEETGIAGGMNFEQCLPFDAISADGAWLRTQEGNEEGVVGWVALEFLEIDGIVEDLTVAD